MIQRFELHRAEDETGVSGTGIVAEGVVFSDGTAALRWKTQHRSTCFYDSLEDVVKIHGHGGKTKSVMVTDAYYRGRVDCMQDNFENVQAFAEVAPEYVPTQDAEEFMRGYNEVKESILASQRRVAEMIKWGCSK